MMSTSPTLDSAKVAHDQGRASAPVSGADRGRAVWQGPQRGGLAAPRSGTAAAGSAVGIQRVAFAVTPGTSCRGRYRPTQGNLATKPSGATKNVNRRALKHAGQRFQDRPGASRSRR
jgi:hypothetical protein